MKNIKSKYLTIGSGIIIIVVGTYLYTVSTDIKDDKIENERRGSSELVNPSSLDTSLKHTEKELLFPIYDNQLVKDNLEFNVELTDEVFFKYLDSLIKAEPAMGNGSEFPNSIKLLSVNIRDKSGSGEGAIVINFEGALPPRDSWELRIEFLSSIRIALEDLFYATDNTKLVGYQILFVQNGEEW